MLSTRYKKVLRDIRSDLPKSIVLIIASAIGVFGIGIILRSYAVLDREMAANYQNSKPASATIELENDSITPEILLAVQQISGIETVERRASFHARVRCADGEWKRMLLFAIDNFSDVRINVVSPESGKWNPDSSEVLIERAAMDVIDAQTGSEIVIKNEDSREYRLKVVGSAYDPGMPPAWQENAGYGYVDMKTLRGLGIDGGFNQLKLYLSEDLRDDEIAIQKIALRAAETLESKGLTIHEIQIPPPGKHPHGGLMAASLSVFMLFGTLLLVLASILVSNVVSTLMVRQIREIGVMKTVGANKRQIAGMYFLLIGILALVATLLAMVLCPFPAAKLISVFAEKMNIEIIDPSVPLWVPLVQLLIGIGVPHLVAFIPIRRGAAITVREAINNYGVTRKRYGKRWLERLLVFMLPGEQFALSLRNVFRQSRRLALSIVLMAIGGAVFMSALNLSKSWDQVLTKIYEGSLYEIEMRTIDPVDLGKIRGDIQSVSGVKAVEGWYFVPAVFTKRDTKYQISHTYPDGGHGNTMIYGAPLPTKMVDFPIKAGRWLEDNGRNEIVLPVPMMGERQLGETVLLSIDGKTSRWKIVGFYEEPGFNALGYTSVKALERVVGSSGKTNMIRVSTVNHDPKVIDTVERLMQSENVPTSMFGSIGQRVFVIEKHLVIIVNALIAMSILMALVGAIGLVSAVSMSILERTKELAVMRTIGATPGKIRRLVLTEGVIIGLISMFFAIALSLIVSIGLGPYIGNLAFKIPLRLEIAPIGIFTWLLIVLIASVGATVIPARRAVKLTIREALTY